LLKPLRVVFAPFIISRLRKETFGFKGAELELYYHPYNMTWASERCVEIPIARYFAARFSPESTLEVGNVLSHYGAVTHVVIDKFERAPGVVNEDITTFQPKRSYDLVLSISTFEHIGFDDESEGRSAEKILAAVRVCRGFLSDRGQMVITVPVGYNPQLDELIASNGLQTAAETFLRKVGPQKWLEVPKSEALRCKYKEPYPYANAIVVAEFKQ